MYVYTLTLCKHGFSGISYYNDVQIRVFIKLFTKNPQSTQKGKHSQRCHLAKPFILISRQFEIKKLLNMTGKKTLKFELTIIRIIGTTSFEILLGLLKLSAQSRTTSY